MRILGKMGMRGKAFSRGQSMAEYALILAAIAVAAYAAYVTLGEQVNLFVQSVVDVFP
jgi:Flp pilus assembly pilin Flp